MVRHYRRRATHNLLVQPQSATKAFGDRAFAVASSPSCMEWSVTRNESHNRRALIQNVSQDCALYKSLQRLCSRLTVYLALNMPNACAIESEIWRNIHILWTLWTLWTLTRQDKTSLFSQYNARTSTYWSKYTHVYPSNSFNNREYLNYTDIIAR